MSSITHWLALARLIVRRDRVRMPLWILGVVAFVVMTASSLQATYPNQSDRDVYAAAVEGHASATVTQGPAYAIETPGGQLMFEMGLLTFVLVSLMSMFLVGRHTRAEEEQGRTELVRAAVVGRHAPVLATLTVVTLCQLVAATAVAGGIIGLGYPVRGSILFAVTLAVVGFSFSAAATVAMQMTAHVRSAYGITGGFIGFMFAVRSYGDISENSVSWLSLFGIAQRTKPYVGNHWWPLLILLAVAVALIASAVALGVRRDVGAGLLAPRKGPANASRLLLARFGMTFRSQAGALVGWLLGAVALGAIYGSFGDSIEDIGENNAIFKDVITQSGSGSLIDAFLGVAAFMIAVLVSAYAVQTVSRLRQEETSSRSELMLSAPVTRTELLTNSAAVALFGSLVILLASGLVMGAVRSVSGGDSGDVIHLVGAQVAYLPAVMVMIGLTSALFGVRSRLAAWAWVGVGFTFLAGFLQTALNLPDRLLLASPFEHVPMMPVDAFQILPIFLLSVVGAVLLAVGIVAYSRRDAVGSR